MKPQITVREAKTLWKIFSYAFVEVPEYRANGTLTAQYWLVSTPCGPRNAARITHV